MVGEQLNAMIIRVTSSDGAIQAKLRHESDIALRFLGDAFHRFEESDLEHQLGRVLTQLAVGWIKGRRQILEHAGLDLYDEKHPHWDARRREFERERDQLTVQAASPDGRVKVGTRGMSQFKVAIKPGTIAATDEHEFIAQLKGAVAQLTTDYTEALQDLREKMLVPGHARTG